MRATEIVYYRDGDGTVPVLEWLAELARRDKRAAEKCVAHIDMLRDWGHELRRPTADYLRDGIYELRVRVGTSQHRILYFFHGRIAAVLAHGLTKQKKVPAKDIERALARMQLFKKNPTVHSHRQERTNG
jgi:phage-related protein